MEVIPSYDFSVEHATINAFGDNLDESTIKSYNNALLLRNQNLLNRAQTAVAERVDSAVKLQRSKKPFYLKHVASSDLVGTLEKSYPHMCMKVQCTQNAIGHPLARQLREVDYHDIYNNVIKYRDDAVLLRDRDGDVYDMLVKDVGAPCSIHLKANRSRVHTCSPILNSKDVNRFYSESNYLCCSAARLQMKSKGDVLNRILTKDPIMSCNSPSQYCNVTAPFITFIHSSYDIRLDEFVTILEKSKCRQAFVVLHYHPVINSSNSGILPGLDCSFEKYLTRSGRSMIRFVFDKDPSMCYSHDLDTYMKLVLCNCVYTADRKSRYIADSYKFQNSTMYIKFSYDIRPTATLENVFRIIPFLDDEPMIVLDTWNYQTVAVDGEHLRRLRLVVPERLRDRIVQYATIIPQGKFTVSGVMQAAAAFNSRETISGISIHLKKPVDPETLQRLVYACYMQVYISNFECGQMLQHLTDEESVVRKWFEKGVIAKLFGKKPKSKDVPTITQTNFVAMSANTIDADTWRATDPWWSAMRRVIVSWLNADVDRPHPIFSYRGARVLTIEEELTAFAANVKPHTLPFLHKPENEDHLENSLKADLYESALSIRKCEDLQLPERKVVDGISEKFVVRSVRGDGDCFFHCLRESLGLQLNAKELRAKLLASEYLFILSKEQRISVTKSLVGKGVEGWANDDVILLAAAAFAIDIRIHSCCQGADNYVVSKSYESFNCNVRHKIDIRYQNNHFDLLIQVSRGCYDPIIFELPETLEFETDAEMMVYDDPDELLVKAGVKEPKSVLAAASLSYKHHCFTKWFGYKSGYAMLLTDMYKDCIGKKVLDVNSGNGSSVQFFCDGVHADVYSVFGKYGDFDTINDYQKIKLPKYEDNGRDIMENLDLPVEVDIVNINPINYVDSISNLTVKNHTNMLFDMIPLVRCLKRGGDLVFPATFEFHQLVRAMLTVCVQNFDKVEIFRTQLVAPHNPWVHIYARGCKCSGIELNSIFRNTVDYVVDSTLEQAISNVQGVVASEVAFAIQEILKATKTPPMRGIPEHEFMAMKSHIKPRVKYLGGALNLELGPTLILKFLKKIPCRPTNEQIGLVNDGIVRDMITKSLEAANVQTEICEQNLVEALNSSVCGEARGILETAHQTLVETGCAIFALDCTIKDLIKPLKIRIGDFFRKFNKPVYKVNVPDQDIQCDYLEAIEILDDFKRESELIVRPGFEQLKMRPEIENKGDFDITMGGVLPVHNKFKNKAIGYTGHTYDGWSIDSKDVLQTCTDEYLNLIYTGISAVLENCKLMYTAAMTNIPEVYRNVLSAYKDAVVIKDGKIIYGSPRRLGRYLYNGRTLLLLLRDKNDKLILPTNGDYVSFIDITVFSEYDIYSKFKEYKVVKPLPKGSGLIQAAAGCGKTTSILNAVEKIKDVSFLILTSTREGRNDVVERLMKRGVEKKKCEECIRTLDSYLMHSDGMDVEVLFIDEALMQHPGKLVLAIDMTKTYYLRAYGDRLQIPFTNRSDYDAYYFEADKIFPIVDVLYISRRVPADIAAILHNLYLACNKEVGFDVGMRSVNDFKIPSYQVINLSGEIDEYLETNTQYLTYLQSDKQELEKKGFKVLTVHEYQGKENDSITLIRLSTHNEEIFMKNNYAVTALTRHSKTFKYITAAAEDRIIELLHPIRNRGDYDVVNALVKIEGGAKTIFCNKLNVDLVDGPPISVKFTKNTGQREGILQILDNKEVSIDTNVVSIPKTITRNNLIDKSKTLPLRGVEVSLTEGFFNNMTSVAAAKVLTRSGARVSVDTNNAVVSNNVYSAAVKSTADLTNKLNFICDKEISVEFDNIIDDFPFTGEPLITVQNMVDSILPGTTYVDTSIDEFSFHVEDYCMDVGRVKHMDTKMPYKVAKFNTMRPMLRTPCPRTQMPTSRNLIHAFGKRNANPPALSTYVPEETRAKMMLNTLLECCLNVNKTPINLTVGGIDEWVKNQKTNVINMVEPNNTFFDESMDVYDIIVKSMPKPDLSLTCNSTYPAPQTILFQEKCINAIYCTIWGEIRDRIVAGLNLNLLIYSQMTEEQLGDYLSEIIEDDWKAIEIDMKKYDKSQHAVVLRFEANVMRLFGVPEYFIEMWLSGHRHSFVNSKMTGIKFETQFQRKSGDASTFFGNTLLLIVALVEAFGNNLKCAIFAGDDSVVWVKDVPRVNLDRIASRYNLEAKLFLYESPYFCSKFLVKICGNWYVVPDPLKRAVKLGRTDLKNSSHVELYRISYRDNVKMYRYYNVAVTVAAAMKERYKTDFDATQAILAMWNISHEDNFKNLYYSLPDDVISNEKFNLPLIEL